MLPGADWNLLEKTVWTESMMTSAGLRRAISSRMRSMQVSDEQIERRGADAQPIAAALDLVLGLLARRVEHRPDLAREVRGRLQQQRGLADARLAAEQHQRPGHDAAAEHAIELVDAGREPHALRGFDFCVQLGRRCCRKLRVSAACRPLRPTGSATRSSTSEFQAPHSLQRPIHFGRLRAAFLTDEDGLRCLHDFD